VEALWRLGLSPPESPREERRGGRAEFPILSLFDSHIWFTSRLYLVLVKDKETSMVYYVIFLFHACVLYTTVNLCQEFVADQGTLTLFLQIFADRNRITDGDAVSAEFLLSGVSSTRILFYYSLQTSIVGASNSYRREYLISYTHLRDPDA
jgi:hypothetical protein